MNRRNLTYQTMIIQNSFVIFFFFITFFLRTVIQENLNQNVTKRLTNKFQRYRGNMKVLDTNNNTFYFDNILYSKDLNNYSMEIEKAFKNMMAMDGVQYIYKRDFYWRTWRYSTKKTDIIFFKSEDINKINCTKCHTGFWVIEEKPPLCQYEILAMKRDQDICVLTPRHIVDVQCPQVVSVTDLIRECGNPIRTKFRITCKYTDVPERNTVICQGREHCEITTLYSIYPDFIVFQILNSTNHVIYSRIMKDAYRNYVYTNIHINFNLIKMNKTSEIKKVVKSKHLNIECFNILKKLNNTEKLFLFNGLHYKVYNTKSDSKNIQIFKGTKAKLSPCKKLQLMQTIEEENENDLYEFY